MTMKTRNAPAAALAALAILAVSAGAIFTPRFTRRSADGQRLAVAVGKSISVFDAAGAALRSFNAEGPVVGLEVCANGARLAYQTQDGRAWIYSVVESANILIFTPGDVMQSYTDPSWSEDCESLVYTVVDVRPTAGIFEARERAINVYSVKADGTEKKVLVTAAP